jgi:hypothetical protein
MTNELLPTHSQLSFIFCLLLLEAQSGIAWAQAASILVRHPKKPPLVTSPPGLLGRFATEAKIEMALFSPLEMPHSREALLT